MDHPTITTAIQLITTTRMRNLWHGMKIATLLTLYRPDKEGCRTYQECSHHGLIARPLLMILFFRPHQQTVRSMRIMQYRGPDRKHGGTEHHHLTRMGITLVYRKGDRPDRTQVNLEGHNFVTHPSSVPRMEGISGFQLHLLDRRFKPQHPTRDRMEQICSFSIFQITLLTWICINCFVPTEIY